MKNKDTANIEVKNLIKDAYYNSKKHGFWEDVDVNKLRPFFKNKGGILNIQDVNSLSNRLMLITGEVSEAHEALRKKDYENFKEELADIILRVSDLAGGLDIDLEEELKKKMEKNKNRPYKHGKEF
ncbi:MazG nucleotide pyrophosphohydrolase domain-containing protein [Clostridium oceanicum]|uniref:MazG nucleotide pyrophosphohydrolase domain-containing protein n=1 Tax=Clostridium oceanicum TaxID=1543 RepID=A0ABN1JBN1_9CLOT